MCQSGAPATATPAEGAPGPFTAGLDVRAGAAEVRALRVDERRLEVLASYDFPARISVDVGLPLLWRTVSERGAAAGSGPETLGLGDLETRARYLAWRRHGTSLSLFAGAKWPTAPVGLDGDGAPLPSALQPGCSSIAPLLGASARWAFDEWALSATGQLLLPFSIREAPHPGDSIRLAGTAERTLTPWLATRASVTVRLETGGRLATDVSDPDSGGAVMYVTTEAVLRPIPRLTGSVGVSFPVIQGFFGVHRESPVAGASLAVHL